MRWFRCFLWSDVACLWQELLKINEVQELEVLVHSICCIAVLERDGDRFTDTLQSRRRVVAQDVVHFSWQVHWKQRERCHVGVEEHHVLVELNAVLEAIGSSQVESLILEGELMEWLELLSESVGLVDRVQVSLEGLPRSICTVYTLTKLDCSASRSVLVKEFDLRVGDATVPSHFLEAWLVLVRGIVGSWQSELLA